MDKERQHVKGATGGKDRQMWRINHLSFSVQAHTGMHARTHACMRAHTQEEIDRSHSAVFHVT